MDVTKISNGPIHEAELRYRNLVEASIDALITLDKSGNIVDTNEALVHITGKSRKELLGTNFFDLFSESPQGSAVLEEVYAKGSVSNFPLRLKHTSGNQTDILFNAKVNVDPEGIATGLLVVARDVTEQARFERELMEAKSTAEKEKLSAEQAMKAKQQFLSNMSHEIRTPLNAIIGFTKVLLKTPLNDKQKEYLTAIKISGDALIVLINDILDLAKVDAGKMTFEQIPFKLSESVSSMLHLFETKLFRKKIGLVKEYDHSIPEVLVGDPVRLHQIILNLVGNAVKFTSEGRITFSVRLVEEDAKTVTIEFSVSDTGIGIAENELESIFDNFQQASGGTARMYGGTGLGLAIVRQLVVSQGGQISVKSKPGEGSTFTFSLSFKKTNEQFISRESEQPLRVEEEISNARILVVEDVTLNQLLMKTLLKEFGFVADTAANGRIAIDQLSKNKYDLILMDLQMPEMNGYEATEHIRNQMQLNIPIIALTADVTTADVEKCKAIGMNDYLAKPIDDKLLHSKIMKFLERKTKGQTGRRPLMSDGRQDKKVVDLNYLREHTRGNPDLIKEMIRIYLEETPRLLSGMKESVNNMDWEMLGEAAHSIIPTFAIMGISKEYEEMAKKIKEHAYKKEKAAEINELLGKVEEVCCHAMRELETELAQL